MFTTVRHVHTFFFCFFPQYLDKYDLPRDNQRLLGRGDATRDIDVGRVFLTLECLYTNAWLRHVRVESEERKGSRFPRGEGPLYDGFVRKPGLGAVIDRTLDAVRGQPGCSDSAASLLMTLAWKAFFFVLQERPLEGLKVAQTVS